jgi:hypothetical protein
MRDNEIRDWVGQLTRSLGEPRPPADARELECLFEARDYAGMLRSVKAKLRLNMRLWLGLANSGGPISRSGRPAPAWVEGTTPMPMYGTRAFEQHQVTVFIRKTFIADVPFGVIVIAMAHELCYVVLDAIGHPLREQEEAVDLTAMLLGYRDFYLKYASSVSSKTDWDGFFGAIMAGKLPVLTTETTEYRFGYLSSEEIRLAARLMRT